MASIKTCELTGKALDWAVSRALGYEPVYNMRSHGIVWWGWWERTPKTPTEEYRQLRNYSTDCAQGDLIIDRENISTTSKTFEWFDCEAGWYGHMGDLYVFGETRLIAAMRCYVTSKLGETVEIPNELLE